MDTSLKEPLIRLELLRQTIRRAVDQSSFYRNRLSVRADIGSLEELQHLPLTSKDDLARHGLEMRTGAAFPAHIGLSSGTTFVRDGLPPATVLHSKEEIEAIRSLRACLLQSIPAPLPLSVFLHSSTHGAPILESSPACFLLPFEKLFHYHHLRRVLQQEHSYENCTRRVEYLSGSTNQLKVLTSMLAREEGSPGKSFSLKAIFVFGSYLTSRWRKYIRQILPFQTINMYGISEFSNAAATECPNCNGYHFPPIVIPEVIGLRSLKPIAQGFGELVLTALYPFSQLQPLIRYRTGDIVEVLPTCGAIRDLTFQPLGRIQNSIVLPDGAVIPSGLLHNVLDDVAEINRLPLSRGKDFGINESIGDPKYLVSSHCDDSGLVTVKLSIELTYFPAHFPTAAARMESLIVECLSTEISKVTSAIKDHRMKLELTLLGPGELPLDLTRYLWI